MGEQPFVFHVLSETPLQLAEDGGVYHIEASEVSLSAAIVRYWAGMSSVGYPVGDVEWPIFDSKRRAGLVIGSELVATRELRGPQCDFWDEHFIGAEVQYTFI